MKPGTRASDLRKVVSHPEALKECASWLKANFPQLPREEVSSTAAAAAAVSKSESHANPDHSSSYRRFFNWGLPLIILAKLKEVGTLPSPRTVRSCKYLNNVVEQDHRRIKQRIRPMLGFKRFETAAVTIRGIELAEKIKKQQFNLKPLTEKAITAPEMWAAALA